jgi:hypothetical protein
MIAWQRRLEWDVCPAVAIDARTYVGSVVGDSVVKPSVALVAASNCCADEFCASHWHKAVCRFSLSRNADIDRASFDDSLTDLLVCRRIEPPLIDPCYASIDAMLEL